MEFTIKNKNGLVLMVIETEDDIALDGNTLHIGGDTIMKFEEKVELIEGNPAMEQYQETFGILIGDELYDLVHESLTNRGIDDELAYEIASTISNLYIDIEVEIDPETSDVEVISIYEA